MLAPRPIFLSRRSVIRWKGQGKSGFSPNMHQWFPISNIMVHHGSIPHILLDIWDWEPLMQIRWKATLINKRGGGGSLSPNGGGLSPNGGSLSPNMSGWWVNPFEIGHLLCRFGEKPPIWVFGEKPFRWKAALVKSCPSKICPLFYSAAKNVTKSNT
jgi:hypothetical protein